MEQTFGQREKEVGTSARREDTTLKSNCIDLHPLELRRDTKDSSGDPVVESFDIENYEEHRNEGSDPTQELASLNHPDSRQLSIPELVADLKKSLSDEVTKIQERGPANAGEKRQNSTLQNITPNEALSKQNVDDPASGLERQSVQSRKSARRNIFKKKDANVFNLTGLDLVSNQSEQ